MSRVSCPPLTLPNCLRCRWWRGLWATLLPRGSDDIITAHTRACAHLSAAAGCLWIITETPHYSAHISFSPFIISYRLFPLRLLSINIIIRSLLAFLALLNLQHGWLGGLWLTLKTARRTGSKVLCITGVFSWSGNGEGHFLITARWHIDPQTASGGQSPSEPLQMLSQEISSKASSPQHTNTHTD